MYNIISSDIYTLINIIRIIIGTLIITNFLNTRNKQTIITFYYSIIISEAITFAINNTMLGLIVGLIIGCLVGVILMKYLNPYIIPVYIFVFINLYVLIETVFYITGVNFSEILKTYDDIYVDYKTIYAKVIISFVISVVTFILFYSKITNIKYENYIIKGIGAYYIIGVIFANTMYPLDTPDTYTDLFISLLNVNFSPYCYVIPASLILLIFVLIAKKVCRSE